MLGSGPRARRLRHRHPRGADRRHRGREEGSIARTPKTTAKKALPAAKAAAKAKPATKAKPAVKTKPSAKAAPATKAKPAVKAKPAAKAATAAKAKSAVKAAPATKAKPAAKAAPATKAKPAVRAKPAAKAAPAVKAKPTVRAKPAARAAPAAKAKPAVKPATAPTPPRPPRGRKREKLPPDRLETLVAAAMKSLEDDKAEDIVLLDVTGRADYADRLIIATGKVERQLQAMAQHLDEALGKAGLSLRRDSIQASPDWVLIDAGDLVIHLFRPDARDLYRIERMWGPESPGASNAAPG